jgi:hypothetical protein
MPHAIVDVDAYPLAKSRPSRNSKPLSRELQQASVALEHFRLLYEQSPLSQLIHRQLQTSLKNSIIPITRILSLGLGSLLVSKGQTRRLKQLTILLAVRDSISQISRSAVEIYAQDPTFTRADEAFLNSLGIRILRTPSGAELGEAATLVSPSTLVYSPFLTIEAYEQFLVKSGLPIPIVLGDDFNALLSKWPKHSEERKQVEAVMKSGLSKYRRRAIVGEGFWAEEDGSFPMAMYEEARGRIKAKM